MLNTVNKLNNKTMRLFVGSQERQKSHQTISKGFLQQSVRNWLAKLEIKMGWQKSQNCMR